MTSAFAAATPTAAAAEAAKDGACKPEIEHTSLTIFFRGEGSNGNRIARAFPRNF